MKSSNAIPVGALITELLNYYYDDSHYPSYSAELRLLLFLSDCQELREHISLHHSSLKQHRSIMSSGSDNIESLHVKEAAEHPLRVIVIGKTGSGKSSLGNILLERQDVTDEEYQDSPDSGFAVCDGMEPGTRRCCSKTGYNTVLHRRMEIIDSPGLYDTRSVELMTTLKNVIRVLCLSAPGPHAVLYLLRCDVKFTVDEEVAFYKITNMYGEGVCKHMVVVFSHGDQLKLPLQTLLFKAPDSLKKIINTVGHNYALVSKTEDKKTAKNQLENLLKKIDKVSGAGTQYFSSGILKKLQKAIEEEVEKKRQVEDISYEQAYAKVKEHIVCDNEISLQLFCKLSIIVLRSTLFALVIGIIAGSIALSFPQNAVTIAIIIAGVSGVANIIQTFSEKIHDVPRCKDMCSIM